LWQKAKILIIMTFIINKETPIAMLTVGQLMELLSTDKKQDVPTVQNQANYVYGLRGIRNLFSVSHATAQRYKEGIIKDAVSQNGRKIIVDREKALELFQQKSGKGFTK
jgi:hypothetical protein